MMLIFYQEQLTHNASLPQSSCHPTTTHKMCSQRHAPQMFSLICPKTNIKAKGNTHPDQKDIDNGKDFNTMNLYDSEVVIHNGQLMSGIVDKKTIRSGMGGLIHTSWLDVGFEETMRFFNQAQQISNYWVLQKSFSIGVIDTIADKKTMIDIEEKIDQAKAQVKSLVQKPQASRQA